MKLKKINEEHYVVVDETIQPVNGYYYDFLINKIKSTNGAEYGEASHCWQITHSTQPLGVKPITDKVVIEEDKDGKPLMSAQYVELDMSCTVKPLSLQEVKELLGEVDVEKMAHNWSTRQTTRSTDYWRSMVSTYTEAYNQAIEDNKEKKYTEAQLIWAIQEAYGHGQNDEFDGVNKTEKSIIVITNYLHPKTEWEVDIINGKLTLI